MPIGWDQALLDAGAGSLVGFSLGLVGGGGSILAVPLLLYVVGIGDAHLAIGTSAVAVAANAAINLANHARSGRVKWPCALTFAAAGVAGAALGSIAGKATEGQHLLALFAGLMIAIGALMLRRAGVAGDPTVRLGRGNVGKIAGVGVASGALSGFFGIGGGFLIVPGLMFASGMPMLNAVASSLVAVTAFGVTTAASYAISGLVDWPLAALFVAGGAVGGIIGAAMAGRLAARRGALNTAFAIGIFGVAGYMLFRSVGAT
jgi:uncharacterized membrane protein YfcA